MNHVENGHSIQKTKPENNHSEHHNGAIPKQQNGNIPKEQNGSIPKLQNGGTPKLIPIEETNGHNTDTKQTSKDSLQQKSPPNGVANPPKLNKQPRVMSFDDTM